MEKKTTQNLVPQDYALHFKIISFKSQELSELMVVIYESIKKKNSFSTDKEL